MFKVAEMHGELIDFNTVLQQKLSEKEFLVEKLRSELEVLTGPLPTSDEDLDTNKCNVNIWIPSAFLTGTFLTLKITIVLEIFEYIFIYVIKTNNVLY